jgi:hypothetical protein
MLGPEGDRMTEQQPYEVVAEYRRFELRRYPEHRVAETTVDGTFESAGSHGFMSLAGYIGGRNETATKVAMTAPVLQKPAEPEPGRYVVGFVMPERYAHARLPEPTDPRVRVRVVPEEYAAAVRYSGRWRRGAYDEHEQRLLADVTSAGLEVIGPPRFARYDPPWTPWFLRRNEVVVPVREPAL